MNKEMLKELVKKHFSLTDTIETPEQTSEAAFADATLVDGTKITNMVDADFEPGQTLHVITEGDVHIIAPEGSHVTDSGIEIVVDGEGVITEVNRPDQATEEESLEETPVEEVAMAEESIVEETELEEVVEEAMEEGDVKEAIVEAIAEVIAPQLEEMKAKLSEVEEKMKEYMSKPASEPTLQSKFNKIEEIKKNALKGEKSAFNSKKAQMEAIIKQNKKQN